MSATLNIEDFTKNEKLFKVAPPVVRVESRQFDVTCHFNKKTPEDNSEAYTEEALRKVCKIHRTLPEGGILVFVTGQQEVKEIVKRLNRLFPAKRNHTTTVSDLASNISDNVREKNKICDNSKNSKTEMQPSIITNTESLSDTGLQKTSLPNINLDKVRVLPLDDDTEADLSAMKEDEDIDISDDEEVEGTSTFAISKTEPALWTLPLYSLLSSEKQARVFQPVPEGHRLCVVATNVAETSLTIPGVKYVVDTGKEKTRFYDKVTGVTNYVVGWISKASANQRAGRAGRQSTGHCYRLYSSAVFEHEFSNHSKPEIKSIPLEELVLLMKAMHIENVINFPFPTPPDQKEIRQAELKLLALGALQQPASNLSLREMEKHMRKAQITPLGRAMSLFPLAPRFAKMLVLSGQHGRNFMQYTITMVAALTMQEVLIEVAFSQEEIQPQNQPKLNQIRKSWAGTGNSLLLGDPMILIRAVGACEYAGYTQEFCEQNGLRYKAMVEIRKLRNQLTNKVNDIWPNLNVIMNPKMQPPTDQDSKLLRQIILSGSPDQIARKVQEDDLKEASDKSKMKLAYKCGELEDPVFLKSSSVFKNNPPEWVTYQEIYETANGKMYMRGVTAIEPSWLPIYCPDQCTFAQPMAEPEPYWNNETGEIMCYANGTFGKQAWCLPILQIQHPSNNQKYRLMAKFLLEGKVLKKLSKYRDSLLSLPLVMVKPWGNLHGERTRILLEQLMNNNISSLQALTNIMIKKSDFLKEAYLKWIPESLKAEVKEVWTDIIND